MTTRRPMNLWITLLALLAVACGPSPTRNPRFALKDPPPAPERTVRLDGAPAVPSVVIAELVNEDSEVHFARNGKQGLLLSRRHGRWLTGPLSVGQGDETVPEHTPKLRNVAPAPSQRRPFSIRGVGRGFVLLWVSPTPAGDQLWAVALDGDGAALGKPLRIDNSAQTVDWVDVLVYRDRAMLVWEVSRADGNDLMVASWDAEGPGQPVEAATGISGWHATASARGAAVAWVEGRQTDKGTVRFVEVARDGSRSKALTLSAGPTALADVQIATLQERYVVAWTDHADSDPHVLRADIGMGGGLEQGARPAVAPVGGQTLIALVANETHERAVLAWENPATATATARDIQLELLDDSGRRARIAFHSPTDAPQLVADGDGFTALTLAPAIERGKADGDASTAPHFVRFGASLNVRAAEPIRVDELATNGVGAPGIPRSVHSLHCDQNLCSLIATGSGRPKLVSLLTLPQRNSRWLAPATTLSDAAPPLATALHTLADVADPIADMSAVTLADGRQLIAWVTHFSGNDDGPAPPGATLAYRFVTDGQPGPITVLSERAISIGGVDAVALPKRAKPSRNDPVAILAWAGPSAGSSQVYLTKLGANGKKLRQKTVTKVSRRNGKKAVKPNEVYDVSAALTPKGNLVCAWTDTRDGNPEIYVARVNPQLAKKNQDRRITRTPGPSTGAAVTIIGERVLLAWADADAEDKPTDIHLQELDGGLADAGTPMRLSHSEHHSRTPRWAGRAAGSLALTWIEEPNQSGSGGARLLGLDDHGKPVSGVRAISIDGTAVTSAAARCNPRECRGVVSGSMGTSMAIGAFRADRSDDAPIGAAPIAVLSHTSAADSGLSSVAGLDAVVFLHDRRNGVEVRRLDISW